MQADHTGDLTAGCPAVAQVFQQAQANGADARPGHEFGGGEVEHAAHQRVERLEQALLEGKGGAYHQPHARRRQRFHAD